MDRLHVDAVSAADAGDSIRRFDDLVPSAYPLVLPPAPAVFERSPALGAPLRPLLLLAVEWVLWSASSSSSLRPLLDLSAAGFFAQSSASSSPLLFTIFQQHSAAEAKGLRYDLRGPDLEREGWLGSCVID